MDTTVVVALIASLASLIVAAVNLIWTARQKKQERQLNSKAELDRYREPLLFAVDELGNRIDNIRNKSFLFYLDSENRRDLALRSTLYRIAHFFCWVEILYGMSGHLKLAADGRTKTVAESLGWIASTFASDRYDQVVPGDVTTAQLAVWREEQRAVGELMQRKSEVPGCVGYSVFVSNYDDCYSGWLHVFGEQLQEMHSRASGGELFKSERLEQLQGLLARLLIELDVAQAITEFKNGKVEKPRWAQPSRFPELR